jgi:hypothetical protein
LGEIRKHRLPDRANVGAIPVDDPLDPRRIAQRAAALVMANRLQVLPVAFGDRTNPQLRHGHTSRVQHLANRLT